MIWWMDAYRDGKRTKEAQLQVKAISSHKYASHCHVPESVVRLFDK